MRFAKRCVLGSAAVRKGNSCVAQAAVDVAVEGCLYFPRWFGLKEEDSSRVRTIAV